MGALPIRLVDRRPIDDATARARLAELRRAFVDERDFKSVGTLDWMLGQFSASTTYRYLFGPDNERGARPAEPPFDPAQLAPAGAKGIPNGHHTARVYPLGGA